MCIKKYNSDISDIHYFYNNYYYSNTNNIQLLL
jgi:hypothetical protein